MSSVTKELNIVASVIPDKVENMSLFDIKRSTWEHELTKNSLVSLVNEHVPTGVLFNTIIMSACLLSPTFIFHSFFSAIYEDTIAFQLCAVIWSYLFAATISKGVYHILRVYEMKKRIFNQETDPLRSCSLKLSAKLLRWGMFITLFCIARFMLVTYLGGLQFVLLVSVGTFAILYQGMFASMQYSLIKKNAKYLVGYIQLQLEGEKGVIEM